MKKEIIKIAGTMINEKGEILVVKKYGSDIFINPGGRVEGNETQIETLKRELKEELDIEMTEATPFDSFHSERAMHDPDSSLTIHVYIVKWTGNIVPSSEIETAIWLSKEDLENKKYNLSPQLLEQIIPALREKKLIKI